MAGKAGEQGVYGDPPLELAAPAAGARQFSPLKPGCADLEDLETGALTSLVMLAPPGALERRYEIAMALKAVRPGGALTILAPKDKGGSRLKKELEGFGCEVTEEAKRHHRICHIVRPDRRLPLEEAVAAGEPRRIASLGLWTQPGVFSWDRIDPGSALLAEHLPALKGAGADFGCGVGFLAREVLASAEVTALSLIDIDRRALEMARRNVADARAEFLWGDVREDAPEKLDFVVMNPPFHDAGREDKSLGQGFIGAASRALKKGGVLWLVANRHLPYEKVLETFLRWRQVADQGGFKVIEAVR
ncbi:MAG: class I SAM-dependent methyltransferase [Caulobacteraceae bacterium]